MTPEPPDIPGWSNLFGSVRTDKTPEQVAALFGAAGWRVRRCSWADYEVFSPFAELVIEARNPVLVHGPVADVLGNVGRITGPLAGAGLGYSFECYDGDRNLIGLVTSPTS